MEWTAELKQEVVERYVSADPTPENTVELTKEIAEEFVATANGVRMILQKAEVYVARGVGKPPETEKKSTRISKADEIAKLTALLEANAVEVDEDILGRLTGKAAKYFADSINSIISDDE